jgi:hypothetical protein
MQTRVSDEPAKPDSSTIPAAAEQKTDAVRAENEAPILDERWPALHQAMQDYKREVADDFSRLAYRSVNAGIIRLEDRKRLGKAAYRAGIRDFDAQLLIACAIRQWAIDQSAKGKFARRPRKRLAENRWRRWVAVAGAAAVLDAIVVWNWLS